MKCTIPEISWHNRDPVLSIDFQPQKINENFCRLASGGTDSHVLIWRVYCDEDENTSIEFVSDLTRHQKAVNAVRFSPSAEYLASGDDESAIIIWRQKQDTEAPELANPMDNDTVNKEQWTVVRTLRGHLEDVYDLCWSPDSNFLVSGSVDNTAIVWDAMKGTKLNILDSHKGFVQGVAWDPLGQYIATLCSDRKMRVYSAQTRKLVSHVGKSLLPVPKGHKLEGKHLHLFHDDTIQSFFRRLCFSPDGQMLIAPTGVIEPQDQEKKSSSTTLVFGRNLLNRPVMYLPSLDEYSVCVRCCPVLFELRNLDPSTKPESLFLLPYRVVFAVATACAVVLYDTQQPMPFGYISNLHYTRLTDLAWSSNGDMLMVSSTDGYCSVITFSEGELGVPYKGKCSYKETNEEPAQKEPVIQTVEEEKTTSDSSKPATAGAVENVTSSISKVTPKKETEGKMEVDSEKTSSVVNTNESSGKDDIESTNSTNSDAKEEAADRKVAEDKSVVVLDSPKKGESIDGVSVLSETTPDNTSELQNEMKTKLSVSDDVTTPVDSGKKTDNPITPVDSGKKARRVQLITLSSPKSKKKL